MYVDVYMCMFVVSPKDTSWESVISFHYVGLRDPSKVARFGGKCLSLMSHFTVPKFYLILLKVLIKILPPT